MWDFENTVWNPMSYDLRGHCYSCLPTYFPKHKIKLFKSFPFVVLFSNFALVFKINWIYQIKSYFSPKRFWNIFPFVFICSAKEKTEKVVFIPFKQESGLSMFDCIYLYILSWYWCSKRCSKIAQNCETFMLIKRFTLCALFKYRKSALEFISINVIFD